MKPTLICDTECYHGFWLVAFKRVHDGKILTMELSDRSELNRERLENIIRQNTIVTFNGMSYDMPLIWHAINGATNAQLKSASDRIIMGNVKYWQVDEVIGFRVPWTDHIDLIEPQPNAFASLKTLNGRLHGRKMQDLPIEPHARLTHADMDLLTAYCTNDLEATELLFHNLSGPLALRQVLRDEYDFDFRSKSDSQAGELIIKKRVEQITGTKVERVETPAGTSFGYKVPDYLRFHNAELQDIVERLRTVEFVVGYDGKVALPPFLEKRRITIGGSTYAMGIGGLHSTEEHRAVHADEDHMMADVDVGSFYPAIILNSGLYPISIGPKFLEVFRRIREDRMAAKRAGDKFTEQGLKIALNGVFGKLGSQYSILYAPHLMIAVTLTGQLALLMLIDRMEQAGISVVSGNTDGAVLRIPRDMAGPIDGVRFVSGDVKEIVEQWESDTGFDLEAVEYQSLYNSSVNTYIAVKPNGKVKRKGTVANPRAPGEEDLRTQLMKNPNMHVCADAVVAHITKGVDIEDYIRSHTDIRNFVTVVNVKGGGTWRGDYLGKVVRYIWSIDGTEILYKEPHPSTGNFKKVSKTDGCRPVMELPDELPADIDYDRYVAEAREILMDIGFDRRPDPVIPVRIYKRNAMAWFAIAV